MARWNIRAQVIDTGVVEMGSDFVIHNGVKVVMPDGRRRFLGRVIMHNEVNSVFGETQGETVQLYLSGRGEGHLALLYGMKTANENVWIGTSPFRLAKLVLLGCVPILLALCLLLIGIPMLAVCLWYRWHLSRWDPPLQAGVRGPSPPGWRRMAGARFRDMSPRPRQARPNSSTALAPPGGRRMP